MKLVASMICRNEMHRYLKEVIPSLLSFCDEVRVVDDASTDGSAEWLLAQGVEVRCNPEPQFVQDEGDARQALFEWTMEAEPTHILAIDADEFVSKSETLRMQLELMPEVPVWNLLVCEVWKADESGLWLRIDGQWPPSYSPVLYKAPDSIGSDPRWRIPSRKLASGREPYAVVESARNGHVVNMEVDLLHFGWTKAVERDQRYRRYVEQDGGEFHAGAHLASIVQTSGVQIEVVDWPTSLPKQEILERVNGGA